MHIPDAYLSPATQLGAYAVMVPVWYVAAKKTAQDLTTRQTPLLSIGAAFCFAVQMFNIPAIGGTTAHALGAVLLAILVGPWAAIIGMTLTLGIQALLFGDGGILSLGANCFSMALVASFVGFAIFQLLSGTSSRGSVRALFAAAAAAYSGTVIASATAATILGIQPLIAHDRAGHALYFPFPLSVSVPAMVITHLLVAAPAEAMITVAALAYLWRCFPEYVSSSVRPRTGSSLKLVRAIGGVIVLTPIGLLAAGSAWGEWDLDKLKEMVGYAPAGILQSHEVVRPVLPDYGFSGLSGRPWEIIGYLASAVLGCGAVAFFTRSILLGRRRDVAYYRAPAAPRSDIPDWMAFPNGPLPPAKAIRAPWFERTVLRMRTVLGRTIFCEEMARQPAFLQSVHPTAKAIGFISLLFAVAIAPTLSDLALLVIIPVGLACQSKIRLWAWVARVLGSVAFFGLLFAIPLCFAAVTAGKTAFQIGTVAISVPGLKAAAMLLLRLTAGIGLATLWNLTTRWNESVDSLGAIGVPRPVLTVATLTYRYLFVILETLGEMVEARTSRQVGAFDRHQAREYAGSGTAVLFSKSLAMMEETHLAMLSRGFGNRIMTGGPRRWNHVDRIFALGAVAIVVTVLAHAF